jgi:hypothetical protein
LIHEQSSLASQIFKAKYYPQTDFLSAPVKTNSSYGWRSIGEAHKVIRVVPDGRDSELRFRQTLKPSEQ